MWKGMVGDEVTRETWNYTLGVPGWELANLPRVQLAIMDTKLGKLCTSVESCLWLCLCFWIRGTPLFTHHRIQKGACNLCVRPYLLATAVGQGVGTEPCLLVWPRVYMWPKSEQLERFCGMVFQPVPGRVVQLWGYVLLLSRSSIMDKNGSKVKVTQSKCKEEQRWEVPSASCLRLQSWPSRLNWAPITYSQCSLFHSETTTNSLFCCNEWNDSVSIQS